MGSVIQADTLLVIAYCCFRTQNLILIVCDASVMADQVLCTSPCRRPGHGVQSEITGRSWEPWRSGQTRCLGKRAVDAKPIYSYVCKIAAAGCGRGLGTSVPDVGRLQFTQRTAFSATKSKKAGGHYIASRCPEDASTGLSTCLLLPDGLHTANQRKRISHSRYNTRPIWLAR